MPVAIRYGQLSRVSSSVFRTAAVPLFMLVRSRLSVMIRSRCSVVSKPYDTTEQRERIITLRRDLTNMNKGTAAVRNTDDDTRDSWPYRIATGMGNQCGPQSTPS